MSNPKLATHMPSPRHVSTKEMEEAREEARDLRAKLDQQTRDMERVTEYLLIR